MAQGALSPCKGQSFRTLCVLMWEPLAQLSSSVALPRDRTEVPEEFVGTALGP